ncbi:MAG TPA: beta-aspartyl-peptidase [Chloroflexia bacterium]|nr:beta-aspartyl-peptidase [Chloroflexia bacterium]
MAKKTATIPKHDSEPALVFTLIENGKVYTPEAIGVQSVLLANDRIVQIGAVDGRKLAALDLPCVTVDATGCVVTPGFIDPHEHLIGAGGERGFGSRTPEVPLDEILQAGVTTVVGCLGTDTITRHLTALLGKARALTAAGITAYMYTGGFPVPPPAITQSIMDDLVLIPEVIGVGEIAIADNRAVAPDLHELAKLVSGAFLGGLVGGKAGVTHFHTGPGAARLSLLHRLLDEHDISPDHLYATHVERSPELMDDAIALARRGAYVDIDVVEEDLARWVAYYRDHDGPPDHLTVSSDAHAGTGRPVYYAQFQSCVHEAGILLAEILPFFTQNTATVLQLPRKGRIAVGGDGDLLVMDKRTLDLVHLFVRGRRLIKSGQIQEGDGDNG